MLERPTRQLEIEPPETCKSAPVKRAHYANAGDEMIAKMLHFPGFLEKFQRDSTFNLEMGTGSP
jgi:hypothetical protein